jgi:hypothetical protein
MRRRISWVLAVGLAALLTACSGELSPGATIAQAPSQTKRAGSARVSYVALFDVASAPGPVPLTGKGVFDYANGRGRMMFDMSAILGGSGTPPEGSSSVVMIVEDLVLYMKMPFLTQMLRDPRPWIKLDLEAAAEAGRTDLAGLTQLGQGDPTQMLELLRGATRKVTEVGREQVRGQDTTHYETVLDLARVMEKAPESVRAPVQSLIQRAGSTDMPADVWIDGGGRMRKLSYQVDLSASEGSPVSEQNTMSVTMELYGFGVDVHFTLPSDDEVVDLLELSQSQEAP